VTCDGYYEFDLDAAAAVIAADRAGLVARIAELKSEVEVLSDNGCHLDALCKQQEAEIERLRETGAFLLGRLDELEWHDGQLDETARQYFGHVGPAVYRFRAALGARNDADA
jgi:1-aminocyclopropane-1-carboxylate deaminase/D-cysteine desulfhydrase-like pyridoxal-dependent ACC family enzyme